MPVLDGRSVELDRLAAVVQAAQQGSGGAMVVHGVAGVGKTALLDAVIETASACRVVRVQGTEMEQQMSLAGITALCGGLLGATSLPDHQREVIEQALGRRPRAASADPATEVMTLGLAVLALLSEVAVTSPLLVVVDDAHWLDASTLQVLSFVARRLDGTRVCVLASQRPAAEGLRDLPTLRLDPLDVSAVLSMLGQRRVAPPVAAVVARHTEGLPLLVVRIVDGLTPGQRAGVEPLPDPLPTGTELEAGYAQLARTLSPSGFDSVLLLAAAGDQLGASGLMAAAVPGLVEAEAAGLVVHTGVGFAFVHPLARSGVYWAASAAERRGAHARVAAACPPGSAQEAWHQAAAATGPDDRLAGRLIELGDDDWHRGGAAGAVAAFQRAAELSVTDVVRRDAQLRGSRAALAAGLAESAELLIAQAERSGAGEAECHLLRADLAELRGELTRSRDMLLQLGAVQRGVDDAAADLAYLAAATLSLRMVDTLASEAALAHVGATDPAVARRAALMRVALEARLRSPEVAEQLPAMAREILESSPSRDDVRFLADAVSFALGWLGRSAALAALADSLHRTVATTAPTLLPSLLLARAVYASRSDLIATAAAAQQAIDLAAELGNRGIRAIGVGYLCTSLAGLGDEQALDLANELGAEVSDTAMIAAQMARGYYHLTHEQYDDAFAALMPLHEWSAGRVKATIWFQVDLAEAALRVGRRDVAEAQRSLFEVIIQHTDGVWVRGAAHRLRAQLIDDIDDASAEFEQAVARFADGAYPIARARALLLWGERLRRARRRAAARERLVEARATFEAAGMAHWADRCTRELVASGDTATPREELAHAVLTAQELQVARWIVAGESNRDVATRLFISPRTVEAHLSAIYRKLGVRGRSGLAAKALVDSTLVDHS